MTFFMLKQKGNTLNRGILRITDALHTQRNQALTKFGEQDHPRRAMVHLKK